jgi:hypothetical protein
VIIIINITWLPSTVKNPTSPSSFSYQGTLSRTNNCIFVLEVGIFALTSLRCNENVYNRVSSEKDEEVRQAEQIQQQPFTQLSQGTIFYPI